MELSNRKLDILSAIIKIYIGTGEPVGSKALSESLGLNLSSATIRNEMSELSELGYLEQPHTSAGRIPTGKGFRLYIDHLMGKYDLTKEDREFLDSMLPDAGDDFDRTLELAASALAEITHCAAISTAEADKGVHVHKIELIPMGYYTALMVLITSSGIVKSRLYKSYSPLSSQLLEVFMNLIRAELISIELSEFNPATMQTMVAGAGEYAFELTPLIAAIATLIREASEAQLSLRGEANLLSHSEFSGNKAKEIFNLLSRRDAILSILSRSDQNVGVILGDDTRYGALESSSFIVARYHLGNVGVGRIGIIGPTRMDYDHMIPSIEYFARGLGRVLSEHLDDMKG